MPRSWNAGAGRISIVRSEERVSGEPEAGRGGDFAALLRELKDRSGLSYGALAKRLHMSTSTLHRYCHGTALPVDYAPVERLARMCRATPAELVELHSRWVLADAGRRLRADRPAPPLQEPAAEEAPRERAAEDPQGQQPPQGEPGKEPAAAEQPDGQRDRQPDQEPSDAEPSDAEPVVVGAAPVTVRKRRRTALLASGVVAAVLAAATVVTHPWSTAHRTPPAAAPAPRDAGAATAAPLTVRTRPYVYDTPCSQHFLVRSEPAQVGPPATEDEAPRWAAAYGAVASGEQRIALTVQGTGAQTVVLEALHVRVESMGAPLPWNDYSMGVGCGGGVGSASFDTDLDAGSPALTPENGQRDFPYKVSESDPEVLYVTAHTASHDVRWSLTLQWSSGGRHGTLRVDDSGTPFRTSADADRPGYDYPLGWTDWIPRTEG
jgi:transcriptional regulator with XRE-family HTH domain